ncbi:hypothetical protein DVA67_000810 [Solirubrobacter sp. CPCC 204708]|nr:hypothetical protein [Solirubrobacter deserti]
MPTIEAILEASRPEPEPEFVEALEARLFTPRRRSRHRFTLAFAGGLAATALAVSLVRDSAPVDADDPCRYVPVTRTERVPFVVRSASGEPRITYRDRSVTRRVLRCAPPRGADAAERAR